MGTILKSERVIQKRFDKLSGCEKEGIKRHLFPEASDMAPSQVQAMPSYEKINNSEVGKKVWEKYLLYHTKESQDVYANIVMGNLFNDDIGYSLKKAEFRLVTITGLLIAISEVIDTMLFIRFFDWIF